MHQVANFSEFEYDGNVGVQIGPHGSFTCICTTDVSAAYGIIGDELFVASFGVKPGEDVEKLHLFSIDLINDSVTDYSRNIIIAADLKDNLCEKCSPSSLVALNKSNTNEIFIVPWTSGFFSTNIGFADYVQTKLLINREKQTCEFLGFFGFKFLGPFYAMNRSLNCSNMGNLEFGKIVYFQGDNLFLCEIDKIQLHIIESDLRAQSSYTFYNCSKGLQCMSFDRQLEEEGEVDTFCCIYDVIIDVERHQAQ
uniref:Uncharacterized protein n=1 Tax=Panagrolaimus superbus TaxID=310955 RepID=A0A914Z0L9_9BILA